MVYSNSRHSREANKGAGVSHCPVVRKERETERERDRAREREVAGP